MIGYGSFITLDDRLNRRARFAALFRGAIYVYIYPQTVVDENKQIINKSVFGRINRARLYEKRNYRRYASFRLRSSVVIISATL